MQVSTLSTNYKSIDFSSTEIQEFTKQLTNDRNRLQQQLNDTIGDITETPDTASNSIPNNTLQIKFAGSTQPVTTFYSVCL